jgi:hypothetical protein
MWARARPDRNNQPDLPGTRSGALDPVSRALALASFLNLAAVLGRQFSHELIGAVAPMPQPQLDDGLAQLVRAELIFQRGTAPDAEYTFKHALVQDAAYDSLLKSRRAQLHSHVAQVLEGQFSDGALERMACAEAVSQFETALTVNGLLPGSAERDRTELQIRLMLASAYFGSLGWGVMEIQRTLEPARDLARSLGAGEQLASILYYVWLHHALRCEYEMADAATSYGFTMPCGANTRWRMQPPPNCTLQLNRLTTQSPWSSPG